MDIWAFHEASYMADGANNVVFRVARAPWVLRFAKQDSRANISSTNPREKKINIFTCKECVDYYNNIIIKTLKGEYIFPHLILERPNSKVTETVQTQFQLYSKRFSEFCSLVLDDFIIMPDITRLRDSWDDDSYCIEIKPKCAYIPENPDCSLHPLAQKYCRFCMQQFSNIKSSVYNVTRHNNFCPLDIFSTCHARIRRACNALFANPQNNLKIFKNSLEENLSVFDDQEKLMMKDVLFQAIVADAHEHPCHYDFPEEEFCSKLPKLKCCSENMCKRRPRGGIFDNIQNMQRMDKVGLEKILNIWRGMSSSQKNDAVTQLRDFTSSFWLSIIEDAKSNKVASKNLEMIRNFLFSMTYRDCSVGVAFSKYTNEDRDYSPNRITIQHKDHRYYFIIKAIDFDPRSPLNIPFYYSQAIDVYHQFVKELYFEECPGLCENILK